ncbi:MAG: hypothetical protein A2314_05045 [Elusimicrobia bacterium RIFOXYB2_FULL_50_12]|nr:MAG: hypothetical protein A2314_05045 [Elusimicrobia bacterium RIFOXYB2_FULL_50_12]
MNTLIPNYVPKTVFLLFCVALALRLGLLAAYHKTYKTEMQDARDFSAVAVSVLSGKGFAGLSGEPTFTRPPVYPLFLAAIYSVAGMSNDTAVKFVQCIVSALSVLLLGAIAALIFGPTVGVTAGFFAALYPPLIIYSNIKLSETLFTFLLLLECLLIIKALHSKGLRWLIYAGLVHGAANLCRSTNLLFPFFLAALFLLLRVEKKTWIGLGTYFLIGSAITSIWTVRNYRVFNTLLPVNVGAGHVMWLTIQDNIWQGDKLIEPDTGKIHEDYPETAGMPRYKWEKVVTRKIMEYALSNPVEYAGKLLVNNYRFWSIPVGKVLTAEKSAAAARLVQLMHIFFLGLFFAGVYLARKNMAAASPALVFILYSVITQVPVIALPRYRLPMEPFMLLFAAYAAAEFVSHIRNLNAPSTLPSPRRGEGEEVNKA